MTKATINLVSEMIRKGDSANAEAAIVADPALATARDSLNDTLLHYAAEVGNVKLIKVLLRQGSDINARGDKGETPLERAVVNNEKTKPVQELLENGADPNIADDCGKTPIYWAAVGRQPGMVKLLKKHNATIDIFTEVVLGKPGKVFKKLQQDPSLLQHIPDLAEFAGAAISEGETALIEFLLDHGLDSNARYMRRPLIYSVLNTWSEVRMLEAFLSRGADPNARIFKETDKGVTQYIKEEYDTVSGSNYSRLPNVPALFQRLLDAGGDPTK